MRVQSLGSLLFWSMITSGCTDGGKGGSSESVPVGGVDTDCEPTGEGEVCDDDNVDEDCNGAADDEDEGVDEDTKHSWYEDNDGDRFGAESTTVSSCDAPADNYVDDGGDCDDDDGEVYPGSLEICNGKDDDCDGTVDIGASDGTAAWQDADGDTYGDPATETTLCEITEGYVAQGGDCDDADINVHPNAGETCFNGVDDDCDAEVDESCPVDLCAEISGEIAEDTTWSANEQGYYIDCDINVGGEHTAVLTIREGTRLYFGADVRFNVGVDGDADSDTPAHAALVIEGGDEEVFMGSGKAYLFPTLSPEPGDWYGVTLGPDLNEELTRIEGLVVQHAGGDGAAAGLTIDGAAPTLKACSFVDNGDPDADEGAGVAAIGGAWPVITDSEFSDNVRYGFFADDDSGPVEFGDNVLTGNGLYPINILARTVGGLETTNTCTDHDYPYIELRGDTLPDDLTVYPGCYPYYVDDELSLSVDSSPTLTVIEGAELYFAHGAGLTTGDLKVEGGTLGVVFGAYDDEGWDGVTVEKGNYTVDLTNLSIVDGGQSDLGANLALENGSLGLSATISDCTFSGSAKYGLYIGPSAEPLITGTTITDNANVGLYIYDSGTNEGGLDGAHGTPSFVGNTLSGNGAPMQVPVSSLAQLGDEDDACSYAGNTSDLVTVTGGTVDSTGTWRALDVPYLVSGDIAISGSDKPVITIEGGATFQVETGVDFEVGASSYGALTTEGTADLPVTFTSAEPEEDRSPGDWKGITFGYRTYGSASELVGLVVEYGGGGGGDTAANVLLDDASDPPSFSGCTLSNSATSGLFIYGSTSKPAPDIADSHFDDNEDNGITLNSNGRLGDFSENTMTGNAGFPLSVPAAAVGSLDAESDYGDNGTDAVEVTGGNLDDDATWLNLGLPYQVTEESVSIRKSATLTLDEPGTTLMFEDVGLIVGDVTEGALSAVGSDSDPIVFTSTTGEAGDWSGISFTGVCGDSELENVDVSLAITNASFACNSDIAVTDSSFLSGETLDLYCTTAAKHLTFAGVSYSTQSGCSGL